MAKAADYGADQIQVLEGLDPVRKRPGMYIGSTGPTGLHHCIWEVVDNSVDEAMAGHATRIDVVLLPDGGCRVSDNGRGIPVEAQKSGTHKGKSTLEVVMTVLHAGGKFGEGGGYKVSGGLHGVGVSVVNALSSRLVAEVARDGHLWTQEFAAVKSGRTVKSGVPQGKPRKVGKAPRSTTGKGTHTGTTITFWPDADVFETVDFRAATIIERLQIVAYLNRGLEIGFRDERPGHEDERTFQFAGGIVDYVEHLNASKQPLFSKVGYFADSDANGEVEVAWQWNNGYHENLHGFANGISTTEGGTHAEGFRKALTQAVNRNARDKGLLKDKEPNLSGDDVREGMTAIVSVRLEEPQFEGQTKTKLGSTTMRGLVERATTEQFGRWLEENPAEAKAIVAKAQQAAKARKAAKAAKDLTRKKSRLDGGGLGGKLADCSSRKGGELLVVEGASAGGSAKNARDPKTQAILPLRGKILNVERATMDKILANSEVQALVTAIGGGIGREFDVTKARYEKTIVMSVPGDEHVLVRDPQGLLRLGQIGPLIDGWLSEGEEVPPFDVGSLDVDGKRARFAPIKGLLRHQYTGKLFRFRTTYGRELAVTSGHSVFVLRDGRIVDVPGDDVVVGDRIVAPRIVPRSTETATEIDILKLLLDAGEADRLRVEGETVRPIMTQRALLRSPTSAYNYEHERIEISDESREKLRALRSAAGITLQQMAELLGYKQAASISEFETARTRWSRPVFERYCEILGVTPPEPTLIVEAEVDRWAKTPDGVNTINRQVKPVCWAETLTDDELDQIGRDVTVRPRNRPGWDLPRFLPVTPELMYLLGWYTAEGSLDGRGRVGLALGDSDRPYLESLNEAAEVVFGVTPTLVEEGSGMHLYVHAPCFGRIVRALGLGGRAHEKRLPDVVLNVSPDLQLAYLRGLYLGDGTKTHRSSVPFATSSRDLASGLCYLLGQFGVIASISRKDPQTSAMKSGEIIHSRESWIVTVLGKEHLERIAPVWQDAAGADLKTNYISQGHRRPAAHLAEPISETLVGLTVRSIEVSEIDQPVYDFSVADDESFIAGFGGGLMAHNSDADSDGGHITVLLLTLFWRYMTPLIESGMVYVAEPPLYSTILDGKKVYVANDTEREALEKQYSRRNLEFVRFKGLGEMDADELRETTMDPATRRLSRITVEQAALADDLLSTLMGDDAEARRAFIQENAGDVRFLDL